jgi:hypothetical protein
MMPINLEHRDIKIEEILLDPNNPRYFDLNHKRISYDKYDNERIQQQAITNLESSSNAKLDDLIMSIKENGFLQFESIVVKPYKNEKFVVIEGNRRIAAVKTILKEEQIDEEIIEIQKSLESINVLVYLSTGDESIDETNEQIIQGIRHISGPKEWGAYQKANLVVKMKDKYGLEFNKIDNKLGLGPRVTPRFYRAYKALEQMMNDEEFSTLAKPNLFSLFEEAIKKESIRNWLGWSLDKIDKSSSNENSMNSFTNMENLKKFYELIVGDPADDKEAVITNPNSMRKFGELLQLDKSYLINQIIERKKTIEEASFLAFPPEIPLNDTLNSCIEVIKKLPTEKTKGLSEQELSLMDEVINLLTQCKEDNKKLNS